MNSIRSRAAAASLACLAAAGCDAPGVAFESAFPPVVCEDGGQRRVRVYGHGFDAGVSISATFGDGEDNGAGVERVDDFTLDVYLPDLDLPAERFAWDPHDFNSGELGLYGYLDGDLEPISWDVLIPRSQLTASGAPDFKDYNGSDIRYRAFSVEAVVVGYEDVVVDEDTGETVTEAVTISGPFNFGYFSTDEPWVDDTGTPLGLCDDGHDDFVGEFCYKPLYYTQGGQPLLYDGSDFAYWVMSEATGDPYLYASWDPYMYKGAYFLELDGEEHPFYYDGRSTDGEVDYAAGDLYNQSFGVFFTLSPVFVYQDDAGGFVRSATPLPAAAGRTFVGMEASQIDHTFFPSVLPISESTQLKFRVGNSSEEYTLESPVGVISRDFDYSLWYTGAPYYDFTDYKAVDLDNDGVEDDVIPVDGSWGCVWLSQ